MSESALDEHPAPPGVTRPKVIFVMGAGRSGSTILGVTLGNCEGVFYAGELDKWLVRAGVPQLDDEPRTRFWEGIREQLPDAAELFGGEAQRTLERSSALFAARRHSARRRLRPRYRRVTEELYRALHRATGDGCIVDTSHYPLRARELQAIDGIELYTVFLHRDPHRVVASFGRRDVVERRFGLLMTNAYLWLTHLLALLVFARQPATHRLFLRHEDFVADPAAVIGQLLDAVGSSSPIPDLTALRTGLPLQGNRLIRSEVIALKSEPASSARRSPVTTVLQAPWAPVFSRLRPSTSGRAKQGSPSPSRHAG